jgi:hypothetical protein
LIYCTFSIPRIQMGYRLCPFILGCNGAFQLVPCPLIADVAKLPIPDIPAPTIKGFDKILTKLQLLSPGQIVSLRPVGGCDRFFRTGFRFSGMPPSFKCISSLSKSHFWSTTGKILMKLALGKFFSRCLAAPSTIPSL